MTVSLLLRFPVFKACLLLLHRLQIVSHTVYMVHAATVLTPRVGPIPRLSSSLSSRTTSRSIPVPAVSRSSSTTQTTPSFTTADVTGIGHGGSAVGSSPHHLFATSSALHYDTTALDVYSSICLVIPLASLLLSLW